MMEMNHLLNNLPPHLKQYIKPQNYDLYSPINQAVWRYVMHKNVNYLSTVAHESYLDGLDKTGISIESIPSMYGMNRILKEIGWAAAAVDGLIPTAAFLEFQAYNVLVIAADIRKLENIQYTPTPDIIHESAGHAPIIANPEYAEYLRRIGEIGSKAISSHKENELFEAVRVLAFLKEKEGAANDKIAAAQAEVDRIQADMGDPSEMSRIKNLHWWTVEYGLIGTIENPKIYGAGLLSSIGESTWCMSDQVQKIPYDINAAYQSFDVTRPQPQLYVTPDFAHLSYVLEQFANRMALRKGGLDGVRKLINSKKLGTITLSTGLQISGIMERVIENEGKTAYVQLSGPVAIANRDKELIGHGIKNHPDGYGTAIGKLAGINLAIENMSPRDLEAYNIYEGRETELQFEGGINVKGTVVTGKRNLQGKILLIVFDRCLVTYQDEVLFEPSMGQYYLAVGKDVISAYAGPADYNSFDLVDHVLSENPVYTKSDSQLQLENLYKTIREIREKGDIDISVLKNTFNTIREAYPDQWLLSLEILELSDDYNLNESIRTFLEGLITSQPDLKPLIQDGLTMNSVVGESNQ